MEESPFVEPLAGLIAAEARASYGTPVAAVERPAREAVRTQGLHARVRPFVKDIAGLCERFGAVRASVFGSAVDPGQGEPSDLDVAVRFGSDDPRSRADLYFGLREALQGLTGMSVDLVELDAVDNPYLRDEIARTEAVLYEAP